MTMNEKILLILVHSTQNIGDLSLLEISIKFFKKYFTNAEIVISANFPKEKWYKENGVSVVPSPLVLVGNTQSASTYLQIIRFLSGCLFTILYKFHLRQFIPKDWKQLLHEYETTTFVAAVPGNQFFSTSYFGWPYPVKIFSVALTIFFGKPLYILPQSIGPLRRWWEKKLLRWSYSKAKCIFLRDKTSLEVALRIGLPEDKVIFSPDPAFVLKPALRIEAQKLLRSYGWNPKKYSIGVTVIAPMGKSLDQKLINQYYEILIKALIHFASSHSIQYVFFTQVAGPTEIEDDRIPTRIIYEKLKKQTETVFIDTLIPPSLLKACYGEMTIFLASRLHSGIFSIGMGVPTLFIGYLTKTRGILKMLGIDKYVIELQDMDEKVLITHLEKLWNRKEEITIDLKLKINDLLKNIDLPYKLIWERQNNG